MKTTQAKQTAECLQTWRKERIELWKFASSLINAYVVFSFGQVRTFRHEENAQNWIRLLRVRR